MTSTFTANGTLASVSDGAGNRTGYAYDGHDRLARTYYPSPSVAGTSSATDYEQLTYDANGNVTQRRLRDAQVIGLAYDALNRLITKDLPGAEPDAAYAYDLIGRLTSAVQGGQTLGFGYDALSRNVSASGPLGSNAYAYDAGGRRTSLTYPGSGLVITYDYDTVGNVTAIRENGATSGVGVLGGDGEIRTRGKGYPLRQFSKLLVSATHPRLRTCGEGGYSER